MENEEMMVDPVSGNEVPPGGTAKGVRDDVPALIDGEEPAAISEGEFILPTHVVNFYGEDVLYDLIENAEEKMREMGQEVPVDPEAIPEDEYEEGGEEEGMGGMSDEDLLEVENALVDLAGYAMGGLVVSRSRYENQAFAEGGKVKRSDVERTVEPFSTDDWLTLGSSYFDDQGDLKTDATGVEIKTFQNSRGRSVQVAFIDGEPIGRIPNGFYEVGTKPEDIVAQEAAGATTERVTDRDNESVNPFEIEGTQTGPGGLGGGELGKELAKAAGTGLKKNMGYGPFGANPYSLSSEQLLEGAKKAANTSRVLNMAGKGAMALVPGMGGLAVGMGLAAAKGNSIANLRAAQQVAEAKGYADAAAEIESLIEASGGNKGAYDMFANGDKKFDAWTADWDKSKGSTSTANTTSSGGSGGGSTTYSGGSGGGSSQSGGGSEGGSPFNQGASYQNEQETPTTTETSVSYGDNVQGSGSQPTNTQTDFVTRDPTTDSPDLSYSDTGNDDEDASDMGGYSRDASDYTFAKGGLVKKRQATPKKGTPKRKK